MQGVERLLEERYIKIKEKRERRRMARKTVLDTIASHIHSLNYSGTEVVLKISLLYDRSWAFSTLEGPNERCDRAIVNNSKVWGHEPWKG